MDLHDYKVGVIDTSFWFKAKNDLMQELILKGKQKKNLKILDLGIGTGGNLSVLNKYGKVYAADINKEVLDLIPKKLCYEKRVCDATKLPYKKELFDIVILFDVLEHVPNDKKAISEIHRVLKKQGRLLLIVPAYQSLFSSHDHALEHQRRYSKKNLLKVLKPFKKVNMSSWNMFLFPLIALRRILLKGSKPRIDNMSKIPKIIDNLLYKLLSFENKLINKKIHLPFGVSILAECEK